MEQNKLEGIKNKIFSKKDTFDLSESMLLVGYEFKMSYEELMNLPIPAYFVYINFLNKLSKNKQKHGNNKRKY